MKSHIFQFIWIDITIFFLSPHFLGFGKVPCDVQLQLTNYGFQFQLKCHAYLLHKGTSTVRFLKSFICAEKEHVGVPIPNIKPYTHFTPILAYKEEMMMENVTVRAGQIRPTTNLNRTATPISPVCNCNSNRIHRRAVQTGTRQERQRPGRRRNPCHLDLDPGRARGGGIRAVRLVQLERIWAVRTAGRASRRRSPRRRNLLF
jgi:hypothetical protein